MDQRIYLTNILYRNIFGGVFFLFAGLSHNSHCDVAIVSIGSPIRPNFSLSNAKELLAIYYKCVFIVGTMSTRFILIGNSSYKMTWHIRTHCVDLSGNFHTHHTICAKHTHWPLWWILWTEQNDEAHPFNRKTKSD